MQTNKEAEQVTLSDLGICCGKTFREPSPVERPKARTSASSSKRSSELSAVPFMSLDLTPGHGNLLGESYWELISPWLGGAWMLNTGVSPNDARESSLSQILQDAPPIKYYLSPKACLGILRRASERGKALPPKLERALKIQAGLMRPDGQPTDLNAFHINQRDEGIDLHGVSGALMATTNMQMQTFVTQPDEVVEGFDGYNGDLTGDVAATLGANCGMSTGRNGVMAFAANQRDEVRDLHDVAGALNAQPGMKQQTFVAAAFSAGAGASAGSIGYGEELAPTLKGSASGNCMPSVLCLNDQGGSVMEFSENVSGTLRAQEHGHQPLVYENHGIDSRYTGPHKVAPTMSARYGTGGNNVPLVEQELPGTPGVLVEDIALLIGRDVHLPDEKLPVLDLAPGLLEAQRAETDGLDLSARQLYARLVAFQHKVLVKSLSVCTNFLFPRLFGHCAHFLSCSGLVDYNTAPPGIKVIFVN